ncbi:hypothetical protein FIBSPDRAFT_900230 [Athelia psychrophila]|uniref:Uncharacterized protein n=1 Tax=Athelia psychrophila TaxID=1759441 RepID=A0A165YQK8_9AGAM|nr:hypothetical protein FIBSPDRAFT_900230 [Fibularhizoctonia sp. CBS 109695]
MAEPTSEILHGTISWVALKAVAGASPCRRETFPESESDRRGVKASRETEDLQQPPANDPRRMQAHTVATAQYVPFRPSCFGPTYIGMNGRFSLHSRLPRNRDGQMDFFRGNGLDNRRAANSDWHNGQKLAAPSNTETCDPFAYPMWLKRHIRGGASHSNMAVSPELRYWMMEAVLHPSQQSHSHQPTSFKRNTVFLLILDEQDARFPVLELKNAPGRQGAPRKLYTIDAYPWSVRQIHRSLHAESKTQ